MITFYLCRSSSQEQFISDSVILGMSKNLGEPAVNWTRSYALSYDPYVFCPTSYKVDMYTETMI